MKDNSSITNYYFHPFIVPIFLLFPIFVISPLYILITTVTSFKGYIFVTVMTAIAIFITVRIAKYLFQLILGRPALTLTDESLFDFQTGLTFDWTDIKEFNLGSFRMTTISVVLYDREKYITIFRNPLTKFIYRLSSKIFHETFTINVSLLKGNNDIILKSLETHIKTDKYYNNISSK